MMTRKIILLSLIFILPSITLMAQNKKAAIVKDTIGNFLTGKRFAIKGYIKSKQTMIHKNEDYLWFRADGIYEAAILGDEERGNWRWDTTKKVIVVKYLDGKSKEWYVSFTKEESKAFNDDETFTIKQEASLETLGGNASCKFCDSWEVVEHKKGNTKVNYKEMDFYRFHNNGVYEMSSNAKYSRGTWEVNKEGNEITITIMNKKTVWTITEWKKEKLYMSKSGPETIVLKPEMKRKCGFDKLNHRRIKPAD